MSGWIYFHLLIFVCLALDLGILHKKGHAVSLKEALTMSALWITLGLAFGIAMPYWRPGSSVTEYVSGYLIEKSLSVDNIFVFIIIFKYFKVPAKSQHRVLYWGILGAIVLRALFILVGIELLHRFHWTIFVMGGFLIFTSYRMVRDKDKKADPQKHPVLKFARKHLRVTQKIKGDAFFVRQRGQRLATPLFLCLLVIELTDVVFAVDSIPAILAVTQDPYIAYTSNIFAILGLRALYFALAGILPYFRYLTYGLALILCFVGSKMLLSQWVKIPVEWALGVIGAILVGSVLASILWKKK